MLLRVPVIYWSNIIRPKCRNGEDVLCGEWVDVEVKEAIDTEAPIAMRWQNEYYNGSTEIKEVRWFNNHHFEPKIVEMIPLSSDNLAELCLNGQTHNNPLINAADWQVREFVRGKYSALSDIPVRKIVSTERDKAINNVISAAENILLVDGFVWTMVGEPVYEYNCSEIKVKHLHLTDDTINIRDSYLRFRADRFDDMIEHFHAQDEEIAKTRIDILIPESVTYDDETSALIRCAKNEIEMVSNTLKTFSKNAIMAWVDLRDAFQNIENKHSPETIAALETALRTYSDEYKRYWLGDEARSALARWDLRPMSHDFDEPLPMTP